MIGGLDVRVKAVIGFWVSPASPSVESVTAPANDWLRLTLKLPTLAVVAVAGRVIEAGEFIWKSGICIVSPEYTATRTGSPGLNRSSRASIAEPVELPLSSPTWSMASSGVVGVTNGGPGGTPGVYPARRQVLERVRGRPGGHVVVVQLGRGVQEVADVQRNEAAEVVPLPGCAPWPRISMIGPWWSRSLSGVLDENGDPELGAVRRLALASVPMQALLAVAKKSMNARWSSAQRDAPFARSPGRSRSCGPRSGAGCR